VDCLATFRLADQLAFYYFHSILFKTIYTLACVVPLGSGVIEKVLRFGPWWARLGLFDNASPVQFQVVHGLSVIHNHSVQVQRLRAAEATFRRSASRRR